MPNQAKKTDEYKILNKFAEYESTIKTKRKKIAALKAALDEKCRARYSLLSGDEIKELLINRKWYKAIETGIQNLCTAVANNITKRIAELQERYEKTMPELNAELAQMEQKVAKDLEQMGFPV